MSHALSTGNNWVVFDEWDIEDATEIAKLRLDASSGRQHSVTRPTSGNLPAQIRGALGEIAVERWLARNELPVTAGGWKEDRPLDCDVTVGTTRIEIMTAQIAHREKTGFAVPPGKLNAARRRGASGYVFVGLGPEMPPRRALIQAFAPIAIVDSSEVTLTSVSERDGSWVQNHVIPGELLLEPERLLSGLRSRQSRD
jgi:hypothetical protein